MNRKSTQREPGFVLVGVVMLILALTILGLSLFSLSSYEAQFLGNSVDELQAYHIAAGAIDRARYVLSARGRLEAVTSGLPPGVDSTIAVQAGATNGDVIWAEGAPDVFIRVRANYQGVIRTMHAWFTPTKGDDYYRRLVTLSSRLDLPPVGGSPPYNTQPRRPQTFLFGGAWIGSQGSDTLWTGIGNRPQPIRPRSVPPPQIDAYIDGLTGPAPSSSAAVWNLGSIGTPVTYYKSPGAAAPYSFRSMTGGVINVKGTVVWMFEGGFRSEGQIIVKGSPNDCLIMVGKRNHDSTYPASIGIWFFGSVQSDSVPLILCSDDEVRIEHGNNALGGSRINYLSIYANNAWLMGPVGPPTGSGQPMLVYHPSEPDDVIDRLNNLGVLPGQSSDTRNHLDFIAGTWSESHPIP